MGNIKDEGSQVVLIDEHNLDKECIRLPSQYLQFAHLAAETKRDVDEARAALKVAEAEISRQIRDTPGKFGLEKVTEKALESAIVLVKSYQEAEEALRKLEYKHSLAQAVVWALEHKKRTLTLLVELHGMSYFSNPKVSEKGREAVEGMTKKKVRHFRNDED